MKKLFSALIIAAMVICCFGGCSVSSDSNPTADGQNKQATIVYRADWPYYQSISELVDNVSEVFEGKIQDIFFAVVDIRTGKAVEGPSENGMLYLCTIYEIQVSKTLKGNSSEKKHIVVMGGIPGYDEEAQLSLMEQCGMNENGKAIPVLQESDPLTIGSEFLFLASNLGGDYLEIPNPVQFAFAIGTEEGEDTNNTPSYSGINKYLSE